MESFEIRGTLDSAVMRGKRNKPSCHMLSTVAPRMMSIPDRSNLLHFMQGYTAHTPTRNPCSTLIPPKTSTKRPQHLGEQPDSIRPAHITNATKPVRLPPKNTLKTQEPHRKANPNSHQQNLLRRRFPRPRREQGLVQPVPEALLRPFPGLARARAPHRVPPRRRVVGGTGATAGGGARRPRAGHGAG